MCRIAAFLAHSANLRSENNTILPFSWRVLIYPTGQLASFAPEWFDVNETIQIKESLILTYLALDGIKVLLEFA